MNIEQIVGHRDKNVSSYHFNLQSYHDGSLVFEGNYYLITDLGILQAHLAENLRVMWRPHSFFLQVCNVEMG